MRMLRVAVAAAVFGLPATGLAFQTTDNLQWPDAGMYPAYPRETNVWGPVRFSVSGGLYHDSNLFRLSDNADARTLLGTTQRSDTVRRVGLGLKADLRESRQHLLLNARADHYSYEHFGFLNNTSYDADATWKWVAGQAWSGDIGYARQRSLAQFGQLQAPIRDLITEDHAFMLARRRLSPHWQVRGGLDWMRFDHGNPALASAENRTTSITLGADHISRPGDTIGAQVSASVARFPNRQVVATSQIDNEYHQLQVSAVATWQVSGKSRFDGRIGYTSRKNAQVSARDFHGVTGRLDYRWIPGAKTLLDFAAYRELRYIENTTANYVLAEGVSFGPHWAPTVRTVVQADLFRERDDYLGDPGFVLTSTPRRVDTVNGARISFGYTPRRFVRLSLGLERGRRDSNYVTGDYTYDLVSANAKFIF